MYSFNQNWTAVNYSCAFSDMCATYACMHVYECMYIFDICI